MGCLYDDKARCGSEGGEALAGAIFRASQTLQPEIVVDSAQFFRPVFASPSGVNEMGVQEEEVESQDKEDEESTREMNSWTDRKKDSTKKDELVYIYHIIHGLSGSHANCHQDCHERCKKPCYAKCHGEEPPMLNSEYDMSKVCPKLPSSMPRKTECCSLSPNECHVPKGMECPVESSLYIDIIQNSYFKRLPQGPGVYWHRFKIGKGPNVRRYSHNFAPVMVPCKSIEGYRLYIFGAHDHEKKENLSSLDLNYIWVDVLSDGWFPRESAVMSPLLLRRDGIEGYVRFCRLQQ